MGKRVRLIMAALVILARPLNFCPADPRPGSGGVWLRWPADSFPDPLPDPDLFSRPS
jgi:hypothetical protein